MSLPAFLPLLTLILLPVPAYASGGGADALVGSILSLFVVMLLAAKVGGWIAERVNQPAVLGELIAGVVLGIIGADIMGMDVIRLLQSPQETLFSAAATHGSVTPASDVGKFFYLLSQIGVVLLLLKSGLETRWSDMRAVGVEALAVAVVGVITPMALGYLACEMLLGSQWQVNLFVASVLAATSVGITVRVFSDLKVENSTVANIVKGAAVIDDVLGLIVLGIVVGLVSTGPATGGGEAGTAPAITALIIIGKAVVFLVVAVAAGFWIAPRAARFISRAKVSEGKLAFAIIYGLAVAWLAAQVGLAPIVGAFLAGLVLEEEHYENDGSEAHTLHLVESILHFVLPVFFILMGLQVRLDILADWSVWPLAIALIIAAIVGKQVCGLVVKAPTDRLAVGFGMIPRGEVGLIIAAIGQTVQVGGKPLISAATFSAVVIMVIVTTLITPPLLQMRRDAMLGK